MAENLNPNIFLSYSWANANIADEIDNDFKSIGIQFKRDVRDLEYRTSIKEFMRKVGKSDFVLMIISDEYLKSLNCMYEVTELLNTHEFEKRILPIVIDNATKIFKPAQRTTYYDYWKKENKDAEKNKKVHTNQDTVDYASRCGRICDSLADFFQRITDLNVSSYENLKKENYRGLLNIIGFEEELLLEEVIQISQIEDNEDQDIALDVFLKKHPNNKYGLFQKADLYRGAKQFKKARKYYEESIAVDNNFHFARRNLALLLKNEFLEYILAKKLFEIILKDDLNNAIVHVDLGLLLEKLLDYDGAKEHYEMAIKADPNFTNAYINLGNLMSEIYLNYDTAKEYYEVALKVDPNDSVAHYHLALLLNEKFLFFEDAKRHYKAALKNNAHYSFAHNNLAFLLEKHFNDYGGALLHYAKAVEADPKNEIARNNLKTFIENHREITIDAKTLLNSQ